MNNDVVMVHLDRPRQLKFGHTALKTLVALTGKTIEEIDQQLDVSDFEMIEQLTYCGLLKDAEKHNETLTLEQIPALLDEAPSFVHGVEAVIMAWRATFGAPVVAEGNSTEPAEKPASKNRSTGKNRSE